MSEDLFKTVIENKILIACNTPAPNREFVKDLRDKIYQTNRKHRKFSYPQGFRIVLIPLVFVIAILIFIGPQNIAVALQNFLGYIPGIGFVDNTRSLLTLSNPVEVTHAGVRALIEDAVSDTKHTRIRIKVDGIDKKFFQEKPEDLKFNWSLVSKEGKQVQLKSYSINLVPFYMQVDFNPLPIETREATLSFSIPNLATETGSVQWKFDLVFKLNQENTNVANANFIEVESNTIHEVVMKLDKFSQLEKKSALEIVVFSLNPQISIKSGWDTSFYITDTFNNRLIPVRIVEDIITSEKMSGVIFETEALIGGRNYLVELKGPVKTFQKFNEEIPELQFTIDLGDAPENGQTWIINKSILVNGRIINVDSAQLVKVSEQKYMLLFMMAFDKDVVGVLVRPMGSQPNIVSYQEGGVSYREIPRGVLSFILGGMSYRIDGNWKINWTVP